MIKLTLIPKKTQRYKGDIYMHKTEFEKYLNSNEYRAKEFDITYIKLTKLLKRNLPHDVYLNIEELLHAEILFKLEEGFKAGYNCNTK